VLDGDEAFLWPYLNHLAVEMHQTALIYPSHDNHLARGRQAHVRRIVRHVRS
jgi:hypothetical protein